MKKLILLAVIYMAAKGRLLAQQPEYINYGSFINVIASFAQSGDTTLWKKTMTSLQRSAQSLKEEVPVRLPLQKIARGSKPLSDEDIYAKRKSSVLVIARLRKGVGADFNFDVLGTGFVVSRKGHCVTNHHVLQQLLQPNSSDNELVYFVILEDKTTYLIKELLSYSQNNDLAIFSLDGKGKQFDPTPIGKPAVVGTSVYCISHPAGELYYFSKGMVARNVAKDSTNLGTPYSAAGKTPIRMEVSADYGVGSSGGPIIDRYGNLVGIVASTNTVYFNETLSEGVRLHPQMVIRSTIPVKALTDLLK
jgi:S1-C subfamily serine protease